MLHKSYPLWRALLCAALLFGAAACSRQPVSTSPVDTPAATPTAVELAALPALPEIERPALPLTGIELAAFTPQGGLDQAAKLGVYWARRNLALWSAVEGQEGQRNWEELAGLEEELISAAEKQLQVILVVRGTPEWAQAVPGSQCGPVKPEKLSAFSAFLHDLVERYSRPPYHVRYWELGNEPDVDPGLIAGDSNFGCWGQAGDPYYGGGAYAEMLKLAYPQIKAADAEAQVLVGGLLLDCNPDDPPAGRSCEPARYLEGILKNGGGEYFDGVSFHAYDYYLGPYQFGNQNWKTAYNSAGPALAAKAQFIRGVLEAYGYTDKYLLNTEAGILCGRGGEEPECQEDAFQQTKAYYVAIANATAAVVGLRANVWYSLLGWRGSGLVAAGAGADLQPLPAFEAMRFSSLMLNGAAYVRPIQDAPGLRGFEFVREGQRFWLLWSIEGNELNLTLPAAPQKLYDVYGTALELLEFTHNLAITAAPVYVVFPPGE